MLGKINRAIALGMLLLLGAGPVHAAEKAAADEAVALVKQGVTYLKANGKEKALAAFSDPHGDFVKGELYLSSTPPTATASCWRTGRTQGCSASR